MGDAFLGTPSSSKTYIVSTFLDESLLHIGLFVFGVKKIVHRKQYTKELISRVKKQNLGEVKIPGNK